MFTAVRLKMFNPKKGHKLRTYVSCTSGTKYRAGEWMTPSQWKVVKIASEIAELQNCNDEYAGQFDIRQFNSLAELKDLVQIEMENGARQGLPPVRAAIDTRTATKAKLRGPVRDLSVLAGDEPDLSDNDPAFNEDEAEDDLPRIEDEVAPEPKEQPAKRPAAKKKRAKRSTKKKRS